MAKNQQDINDRLEILGFDYVIPEDSTYELVNDATLNFIGNILINGIPFGSGGGITGFVHTQASPATTWTVNHNLGYKPEVQVYNAGSIQVLAEVEHSTVNQTIIRIAPATSGFARFV